MDLLVRVLLPIAVLIISVLWLARWAYLKAATEAERTATLRGLMISTASLWLAILASKILLLLAVP